MTEAENSSFPTRSQEKNENKPVQDIFVLLSLKIFFFGKDFLWTMDRDRNGDDGLNGQEWTAEGTMDDGRWTMNDGQRLCRAFQG